MPENPTHVSVIIVNFNGRHLLEVCLESVLACDEKPAEVIVVDNGSEDGSVEWLAERFPDVVVDAVGENLGFGAANGRGVEQAREDFVCFLNNDTIVVDGWLGGLTKAFASDERIGAACSTLELMDSPGVLNARGGGMTWLGLGHDREFGVLRRSALDGEPVAQFGDTLFPTAAAMLIRKKTFVEIGGFDPRMFMYHEDVDLGWRLWLRGYRVVVCRDSLVRHAFGGTTRDIGGITWSTRMGFKHDVRSMLKNYQWWNAWVAVCTFLVILIARVQVRLVWHMLWWNTCNIGDTLRQRRKIQRSRCVSDLELFRRGLIDRRRIYPVPSPVRPLRDVAWMGERLIEASELVPAADSSGARLGGGWYAPQRWKGESLRAISGAADCFLRVAAGVKGRLSVELRYECKDPKALPFHVACNGEESSVSAAVGEWTQVSVPATAGEDGLVEVALTAAAAACGPIRSRRSQFCLIRRLCFHPEGASADGRPDVSVVIPTYNRRQALAMTLDALRDQTVAPAEVIVVDDGSDDDTWEMLQSWAAEASPPFRFHPMRQENSGPARARNAGAAAACGEIVAFLGDDTIPQPSWLEMHLDQHAQSGPGCAVVGYTAWDSSVMRVTPFLRFVNGYGVQFGYSLMPDGKEVPFTCFYTSNLSLARSLLLEEPFDEAFRAAGWEDAELGYRLSQRGFRMVYCRSAQVAHHHPSSMMSFMRRQELVGRICPLLLERHPELGARYDYPDVPIVKLFMWLGVVGKPVLPLCALADRIGVPLPHSLYKAFLGWYYVHGLRQGRRAV